MAPLRSLPTLLAAATATLALAGPAVAAPGALDPSFSGDGRLATQLGAFNHEDAVAVQPDGRIVVAGGAQTGPEAGVLTLRRFTSTGAPDTSFGGGDGLATVAAPEAPGADAVVVQPDGRILVGGGCGGGGFVERFKSGGAPDPTWTPASTELPCAGNGGGVAALALQPDGRILVGGSFQETAGRLPGYLGRLLPDGTPDSSFVGYEGTNAPPFIWSTSGIVVQPDGRIVAADDQVKRLRPDGTPDPAFDLPSVLPDVTPVDVAVQGDGRIVSVGTKHGDGTAVIERRRTGGALDPSFSGDGRATVAFGGPATALDVQLQLDGRILVTGAANGQGVAFRLRADGTLDPSFGTGGRTLLPFTGAVRDTALQADGRLVVTGAVSRADGGSQGVVARLQGDPVPFCSGKRPTIAGTGLVLGSSTADVIVTSAGADTVIAGAGNDTVCSGAGDDDVDGGSGADALFGGAGADRLQGWTGADQLFGEAGNDRLFGGADNDRLDGGADTDVADGGAGTDTGIRNEQQTAIP
jgi:uncharacterized delta-60 repeat protein